MGRCGPVAGGVHGLAGDEVPGHQGAHHAHENREGPPSPCLLGAGATAVRHSVLSKHLSYIPKLRSRRVAIGAADPYALHPQPLAPVSRCRTRLLLHATTPPQVNDLEEVAAAVAKQLAKLPDDCTGWPVWSWVCDAVDAFKRALPLVTDLRSASMRPRHWQRLRERVGKE